LAERIRCVVAIDGKTVRGSKEDANGKGALHLVAAFAHEAGLVLAQRAVAPSHKSKPPEIPGRFSPAAPLPKTYTFFA
jgi:hypothetical protein